jgi:hypothetical protein
MFSTIGERTIGVEAAQLIAVGRWMQTRSGGAAVRLESSGKRYQVAALIAAALEPDLFSQVAVRDGMHSLKHMLDAPVRFQDAPDLFCLDLLKEFDLERLAALAGSGKITQTFSEETPPR